MPHTLPLPPAVPRGRPPALDRLARAVAHAAHLLPAQGPIGVFIHHNTLHAFEDLPFTDAVARGAQVFGCQPYLSEDRYRQELLRGRIRPADLAAALDADLGGRGDERVAGLARRRDVRQAMLGHPLRTGTTDELLWFVAETDALRRVREDVPAEVRRRLVEGTRRWVMRDLLPGLHPDAASTRAGPPVTVPGCLTEVFDRLGADRVERWDAAAWEAFAVQALWRVCREGVAGLPDAEPALPPVRHRDLLFAATGADPDLLVNDLLTRFCAAFLDQGLATWALPDREAGFLRSFAALCSRPGGPPAPWLRGLRDLLAGPPDPLTSIHESLAALGVADEDWEPYLAATVLALRGWAGMLRQVEERPDRVARPVPPGTVLEFLAVRLLLDRLAAAHVARDELGYAGPLADLRASVRPAERKPSPEQRAFLVFQVAQLLGWEPARLLDLGPAGWAALVAEVESFSGPERRRVFHLAYERRFCARVLDALSAHAGRPAAPARFQAVFCIDEREESVRRHLEEVAPDCETFGAAGFFAVPMFYRGAGDAHFRALCPVVIRPRHYVCEEVDEGLRTDHRRRASVRRALGAASRTLHLGSRSLALGVLMTAGVGVLATIPLVGRVLFPWLTGLARRVLGRVVQVPPRTRLRLERKAADPGPAPGGQGFTVPEMADMAERLLRDAGLTRGFARLVVLLGHGSSSLNNPHRSAYDCGACGGSPGGPNARTAARILNDVRIRRVLADRGLDVPEETVFVGGYHNTCTDGVTLFETDRLPDTHWEDLAAARRDLTAAADRNAHERCRRFLSAPLDQTPAAARLHVEGRAEDLSQARPECGHATNAVTVVGRRARTRGLFLDRRAFLTSYDPTQDDPDGTVLARILGAVFPVCGGISLEYFFSYVDNPGYGAGTKLPHNITSLLGVMDGAGSDLRTGLPWQMVEIHEPMRHLFVLETRPEVVQGVFARHPALGELARNGWVRVAVLDPGSNRMWMYEAGELRPYHPDRVELPRAASSVDWYRGWRDHLEFAVIGG